MLATIGATLQALGLASSLLGLLTALRSASGGGRAWTRAARRATQVTAALIGLSTLTLLMAFLFNQFQIEIVFRHADRRMPLHLKVSALWAGQRGSLLLWSFLQALLAALAVGRRRSFQDPLLGWASVILNSITAFFVGLTLVLANPFRRLPVVPADGLGMAPLLRHPGMVFHPPALYVGYVSTSVPFAFAMAAVLQDRIEGWVESTRGWILMAWVFLSLGLLLGARWAYDVLDWGGYWGWDPVENAGLLPWLTVTALLHSGRKRGLRAWSVVLAALSFVLVLFGAFATRGGMIESVHSFTASDLGVAFLVALFITALASIILLIARRHSLRDPEGPPDQILSPTGTSFLTVLILLAIVVTVLVGSLLPTLTQALGRQALRASPAWFDRVTAPLFASLILVMGICSWLGRRDAAALFSDIRHSWSHLGVAWVAAVATPIAARAAGFSGAVPLISLGLLAWAGATASTKLMRHFIQEAHRPGRALWRRLPAIAQRQHRRWGAAIIHLGIVIMGFGVVGTRTQATEAQINLAPGQSATVSGYTIAYESYAQELGTDTLATQVRLSIYRHQTLVAWMMPTLRTYVGYEQTVSTPAVLPRFREDLYVTLAGWQPKEQLATLKIFVNPLASFIWVGGALLLVGGLVAAWPDRSLRQTARAKAVFIPLALTLVLAMLGSVLWRTGDTVSRPVSRRPDRGQTAPGFRLSTLDGQTMTLPSLRGQVVIVAFWATWCPSCQEELNDLQAIWSTYQNQDVIIVGIAYDDSPEKVRQTSDRLGLTYPLSLDNSGRLARSYGVTGVPEVFVIDPMGLVAHVHIGPVSRATLQAEIDDLLSHAK